MDGSRMKITYKRDPQQSWLIVVPARGRGAAYPSRILAENTLRGILPCRIARLDGEEQWYFSISGYRSLEDRLETGAVTYDMLRALLIALLRTAEELEDYLLSPDDLLLAPEFCFLSQHEERFAFAYCPEAEAVPGQVPEGDPVSARGDAEADRFASSLRALSQELLSHLDRTDSRAILLGYAFFRRMAGEETPVDALRGVLSEVEEPEAAPEKNEEPDREREILLDSLFVADEEEEQSRFARWREKRAARSGKEKAKKSLWERIVDRKKEAERDDVWSHSGVLHEGRSARPEKSGYAGAEKNGYAGWERSGYAGAERDGYAGSERSGYTGPEENGSASAERRYPAKPSRGFRDEMTTLLTVQDVDPMPSWRLVATERSTVPQEIPLQKERCLVGKEEAGADVSLEAKTVSRLHALLSRHGEGYAVRDLNSRNGTTVQTNGESTLLSPRQIVPLQEGDRVCFADVEYVVRK